MTIEELAKRFQGVDVKYRRDWGRWAATNHASKNERAEYRVTVTGATAAEAVDLLLSTIALVDRGAVP